MKNVISLIGLLFFLSTVWEFHFGQNNSFPLSLVSEDVEYLRTVTSCMHSRPYIHHSIRDIYKISVTIQVKGKDRAYSSPFVIRIIDSRGKETDLRLNNNRYVLLPHEIYIFQMEASLNSEGFARLLLGEINPANREFYYDKFSSSVTETTIYISKFK